MTRKRKTRSVFETILLPLLIVLAAEMLLLAGSLLFSGVYGRLNENAADILEQQVENRKIYLENEMVDNWSNLSLLAGELNGMTQAWLDSGSGSLEALDGGSDASAPLLLEMSGSLVSALYSKQATGIFVTFRVQAQPDGGGTARPGLYIRDLDPVSAPSYRMGDLLLERAPIQVVRSMRISTDNDWQPMFTAGDWAAMDVLSAVLQAAESGEKTLPAAEYGGWTTQPYTLQGDDRTAVAYAMPLVLEDGTVYGVVGVELLTSYLQSLLPCTELQEGEQGLYLLGVLGEDPDGGQTVRVLTGSAGRSSFLPEAGETLELRTGPAGSYLTVAGAEHYAAVQPLELYSRNGPFSGDQWVLIGAVRTERLFAFSNQVLAAMLLAVMLTFLAGIVGSVVVSRRLSRPISRLSAEVEAQQGKGGLPVFSPTGIQEIDQFSGAITELSRDVLDTSTKFLRIMEMASVELGGYELRDGSAGVYVTDNFFPLLGLDRVDPAGLTADRFHRIMDELDRMYEHGPGPDGNTVYQIRRPDGTLRYLRVEVTREDDRQVGLVEDVTAGTLERMRIERERDCDLLTGLCSRWAFQRKCGALFQEPERMAHAALLMMDLDDLKQTNDSFGHDWGDQYIRQAGQCFAEHTPPGTLCARVSGDEFFLLFYGYESRDAIRAVLARLTEAVRAAALQLPSGRELRISASGGVAWYPEDSRDLSTLMKYADFAMYQVKQSRKGEVGEFDLGVYNREAYRIQTKREFHRVLEQEMLAYHFQPIVSGRTGRVVAYEALMRVDQPTLHTPDAVMRLAREEDCLHDIERITMFKSAEAFQALLEQGAVEEGAMLFVNSLASQSMTREDDLEFHARFASFQHRIVVEITEAESLDLDLIAAKRDTPGFSGTFALDDFGSGYNSEKSLLELAPRYVKVDLSIIRNIDTDPDKQQILENIVAYAHQRDMLIIAEGVETAAEAVKVLELGTDLLQGFYLARPAAVPGPVNPAALMLIEHFWKTAEGEKRPRSGIV